MTIYTRPDELVFAENANPGEVTAFPDIQRGWGVAFEQTEGKPPMEWMNAVMKRQDEAIRYLLQRGLTEWSATEDYPAGALLQRGWVTYRSLVASRGVEPGTSAIAWELWGFSSADVIGLTPGRLIGVRVFDSAGTFAYASTDGTKSVIVECQGAGGAGGGCIAAPAGQASLGHGGGAGAYGKARFTINFNGVTITVGAAGIGSSGPGGNGGATSFGALLSCPGGLGSSAVSSASPGPILFGGSPGNSSGAPSGGSIEGVSGEPGKFALLFSGSSGVAGAGGDSRFGASRMPPFASSGRDGEPPVGRGAGGTGASANSGGAGHKGGDGAQGMVIVWEYA